MEKLRMGTLPMATQLLSGRAKARIQTRGARGPGLNHRVPGACTSSTTAATVPGGGQTHRDQLIQQRNEASDWPPPATTGEGEGPRARGRRGEMTQRRGSLKAQAPCAADGAGAFRGLPLLRAQSRAGRARARAVQTGRAPDAGSSRGLAGRLGQLDQRADEPAPRWPKAALCPTHSMPRVCCERSALSARSPAFATRTWSSTGRRSRCRRTSWRRPAHTSGEEGAAAGRAGPR